MLLRPDAENYFTKRTERPQTSYIAKADDNLIS